MKEIIFIGAGGFGSECYEYLCDVMALHKDISFKGFLSTSNDLKPLRHLNFLAHKTTFILKTIIENNYKVLTNSIVLRTLLKLAIQIK
ncbi:hypothetical protein [Helicobacter sp. 13S00477-4]|uniref:hypothetical protein n=1 Tax=Helicobacter sp. 13S00477-4 TaxID=1905759 RepID=UPI000BA68577|nr:hypothetical protein [Helicobacter sp. 13S00477-4]PAF51516.1 hypothetical protein BKH44_05590 [Helicobacter sp. 13S00477-4]